MFFSTAHTCRVLKTVVVTAVLMLLTACSPQKRFDNTLAEAEQLVERNADSTMLLLSTITDVAVRGNSHSQALYGLLLTQAKYKLYQDKPDSLLPVIAASREFFRSKGDQLHFGRATYYTAMMRYKLGQHLKATDLLKESLSTAEQQKDSIQMAKCYESLVMTNSFSQSYIMALAWAKKLLFLTTQMGDTSRIVRNLDQLSVLYATLGYQDSSFAVKKKIIPLTEKAMFNDKGYILANIGIDALERGDTALAKEYSLKAIAIDSLPHACATLAIIYMHEGNMALADALWQKAFSSPDDKGLLNRMKSKLKNELSLHGMTESLQLFNDIIALDNSLTIHSERNSLIELQKKYDKEVVENRYNKQIVKYHRIAIVILFLGALLLVYHINRIKNYESVIRQNAIRIQRYESKIGVLTQEESDNKEKIEKLRKKINQLQSSSYYRLSKGKIAYDNLMNGKPLQQQDAENEPCLVEYFAIAKYDVYSLWSQKYKHLTLRLTTFLILQHLGYDDSKISELLNVSKASVRMTKSRLNKQLMS